ncbi:132_t:CDS:2 [Acaulospora colombiana]|uniref:132_t:CDS:1 n=1 Tax=Acaulospora colombiana TaxID=27376 RepID=A0ACA9M7L0_9GLOM|nr:132_t:CDS:2 [Acaulospora colombiana]
MQDPTKQLEPTNSEDQSNASGDVDESTSQSLARLYQKASRAGARVIKANQEEFLCWYQYAEGFENRVIEIRSKDRAVTDPAARSRV